MTANVPASANTQAIVFLLDNLPDLETLRASVPAGTEVRVLDASGDALAQMAGILADRSGIDAVHLLTHGGPGRLDLGTVTLDSSTLASHDAELAAIRSALSEDADLMIYGCDVAAGDAGRAFIGQLSALTGADVAASTNLTGATALGGDWTLEASTGSIEAPAVSAEDMDGILASGILKNKYIRFGYSDRATFGYGGSTKPGIQYDKDGAYNFLDTADYLTPGSPWEMFTLKIGSASYNNNNTGSAAIATTLKSTAITTSGSDTYGSLTYEGTVGGLKITQTYTLGQTSQVIAISVTVENVSGGTVNNVSYARGIDPDVDSNGLPGSTSSTTNVRGATGISANDIVLATGPVSGRVIGLYTNSSFTHNTGITGWTTDPSTYLSGTNVGNGDNTIGLGFDLGSFTAGQSKTFSFAYVFAASAASLQASVDQVPPSNPAPTLTDFIAPVATFNEDASVTITYADLIAAGNEADLNANGTTGTVAGFVVKSVASGTLKINGAAWAPGTNDTITSAKSAVWTPAANANGNSVTAFSVVARDAEGATSSSNVAVNVKINAINDNPTIASSATAVELTAISEDQAIVNGATVSSLFAPRFVDVDAGSSLGGIIVVGDTSTAAQGKWEYSTDGGTSWFDVGTVSTSAGLALSATSKLRFTPTADWNGTPGALTVYFTDDAYAGGYTSGATRDTEASLASGGISSNSVNLTTKVNSVNDLPEFTSAAASATLKETAAYDNAVGAGQVELDLAANPAGTLSGTLEGNDSHDVGGSVTFGIRGGTTAGSIVTKQGFFGTLTLDTTTKAWTYTPTNFSSINALTDGATANDSFEFKIVDNTGASVTQALTITLQGTNDTPVLSAAIADQTYNGSGVWYYQIPANTFSDAEGLALTYVVKVNGTTLGSAFAASYDSANPASWLSFDEASRTIVSKSGVPLASLMSTPLSIEVTATDSGSATVSDTFQVSLSQGTSAANPAANVAPTSTNDHVAGQSGTATVLGLGDFGAYNDLNGDALASVKITSLPASGSLQYSSDGTNWSAVTTGQVISAVDILAGKLRVTPGNNAATIGFQVGDGTEFSGSSYTLAVDTSSATGGVAFAASAVTEANAGTWTSVYSADPLTGFSGTVRIVAEVNAGNLKLADATGVTVITTGYGNATNGTATSIAFEGTQAEVNAALQQLQVNVGSNSSASLSLSAIPGGAAYNPVNGHFYEFVTQAGITWDAAKTAAAGKTLNGLQGYLATITSASENTFVTGKLVGDGWIGASDAQTEGTWKWVTGPEAGTQFWQDDPNAGTGSESYAGSTVNGQYANWQTGEPNNSDGSRGGEDVAHFYGTGGNAGKWNDYAATNTGSIVGYIVEYGGMDGDPALTQASRTVTLSAVDNKPVLAIGGVAAYTENAAPKTLAPTLQITDRDSATLKGATVKISAGKVAGDVLAFANGDATAYGNIVAAWDDATGTLTLQSSGNTATLAQWEAALKAVTFESSSNDPGASRTLQWQVIDPSNNTSSVGTTTIAVTQVNDAPIASNLSDVDVAAGGAVNINLGTVFSDPEGNAITYSVKQADGTDLPAWLSFNSGTNVLSGNPPAGLSSLSLKVIGTDNGSPNESGSTTFTLNFGNSGVDGVTAQNNIGTVTISGTPALGATLTAAAPTDADGYTATNNLHYQWQSKAAGGGWTDINGATNSTYVVTQAESSKDVRVIAYYTDNGGFAEAPESNALTVPKLNVPGVVTVNGSLSPGQTLVATLQDDNGLTSAAPTYTWYRGDSSGAQTTVVGGNFSTYTLTDADAGKYITVKVDYTDDEGGSVEHPVDSTDGPIQLGAVAPVAVNDTGAATEAGGISNGSGGGNASGNILVNDTDLNSGDTRTLTAVRTGNFEGLGDAATVTGGEYVIAGEYGTLRVNATSGAYTYTVDQNNPGVQALNASDSVKDYFNYSIVDSTTLSDNGVLEITINGANDAPTVSGAPASFTTVEDAKTAISFPDAFSLSDVDSTGTFTVKLVASAGKLNGVAIDGVTVSGNDTNTLTLTGPVSTLNAWLKTADVLLYTSAPNVNGDAQATITLKANDGNGSGDATLATVNVNVTATNDAPVLDLNANNDTADGVVPANATGADLAGNDHAVVFRARGGSVQIVDSDISISDVDGDTTMSGATAEITAGAWDNARTIYETLSSTSGGSYAGTGGTITITGNGSGTGGLTGATKLTLAGTATRADYEAALKTIVYNNTNDSAFAGNRVITVTVQDKADASGGLVSNAGSFTIASANAAIAVGQKIYIGGTDTGQTVASVSADKLHFVASGALPALANDAAMTFWLDGAQVTSATAKAPLSASGYTASSTTTTVQVIWAPVADLNGNGASGTGYAASYTEGDSGTYIAATDASITDQDGNLKSVTVTLTNAADTFGGSSTESLFIASNVVSNLAANGITTTWYNASGNSVAANTAGTHKIVFTGNKDATTFQLGLREVQYKNTSENPSVTPRVIKTTLLDQDNNSGVSASTTIHIVPKNDAPVKGGDFAATLNEGAVYVFSTGDLNSTDVDDAAGTLKYLLTAAATHGKLFRDSNNNGLIDSGEAIDHVYASGTLSEVNAAGLDGYFTQAEVTAGRIKYLHDGSETTADSFAAKVVDGGEDGVTFPSGTFVLTVTPQNDAPSGAPVVTGTATAGETLTADTSGISDGDGPGTLAFSYQWEVSANGGTSWTNIGGATANTYTLTSTDSGKTVRVKVTYTDAGGTNEVVDSSAVGVALTNTAPTGGLTIAGTPPVVGGTLKAVSTIDDADGMGPLVYKWETSTDGTNWTVVTGATAPEYTLGADDTGKQFRVSASYTDGRGSNELVSSAGTIAAVDVNNAPFLKATGVNPTLADGSIALYSGASVSAVESGQLITGLTLTVRGLLDGNNEKLILNGQEIALEDALAGTTTAGAIGYSIAVAAGTATVTLTHAGMSSAALQTLVDGLKYNNAAATPQNGMRVVTIEGLKDSGGTANGGDDTAVVGVMSTVRIGTPVNTAPAPGGTGASGAMNEGGVHTLTLAELSATDPEHPASGLIVTVDTAPTNGKLFLDANTNGVMDAGEELATGALFTLADVDEGRVMYAHDGTETTTDGFAYTVSDGLAASASQNFSIAVTAVDDAPSLSATALNPAFAEGSAAAALFGGVAASAVESGQQITQLKLMVSGLRDGADEHLVIDGEVIALTAGATGATTANGFGYTVAVVGGTATVTVSKSAGDAVWTTFIGGIKYENASVAPTPGNRAVTLLELADDGTGPHVATLSMTSKAAATLVNDAPSLSSPGITVTEGASLTLDTVALNASDVDSPQGNLVYTLSTAPVHGSVYIDANGNGVKDSGEGLSINGQFTHAQLASGKVRYVHDGSESGDSFGVKASDGSDSSAEIAVAVTRAPVNDVPSIAGLGTDVLTYAASHSNVARVVEQGSDAIVSDPDSAHFNDGALRVSISFNRDPAHDVLSIKNVGTATGQIGVAGSNVTYGGTVIGTVAGGSGTDDLVVTFNADATPDAVGALVRAVQFQNDEDSPAATSRTISFALNDGATDGQAAPVSVNVSILTGVSPSISIGNGFFVMENTTLVTALSAVDPNNRPITFSISSSNDANNEDGAKFSVGSDNLLRFVDAPDYETPGDVGANRVYKVMVRATNDIGVYAEQALTISLLDQVDESAAVGDDQAPVLSFATVNGSTLTLTYNDLSALDAVNAPAAGRFAVTAGGTPVAVNSVAVDAANRTVTLTLASAVAAGAAVKVSYADPTAGDDVNAIQDAGGRDAATLTNVAVTNLTPGSTGGGGGGGGSSSPTTPPKGEVTGGSTTVSTGGDGTTTKTTNGKLGDVTVVEKVITVTGGKTEKILVYVPAENAGATPGKGSVTLPLLYENVPGSDSNTTVNLPSGIGLTSIGDRTPAANSKAPDLIDLIKATVSESDAARGSMLTGGQNFLDARSSASTLWVNKIELTASPALDKAPDAPIVINGAANNSSSNFTGDKLEALVIDGTKLPKGTVLELENVDFAVVVGDGISVRGGNGANVVYGGSGSQNIFLGADDDVLYGGDGDDTVGSASGADRIFGNSGDDTVFGGAGSDLVHGGANRDVATFDGKMDRYAITRDHGITIVRSLDEIDNIDTLVNVETIRFGDATYTVENAGFMDEIASLYGQIFDRQADLSGFQYWTMRYDQGMSMGGIALSFLRADGYKALSGVDVDKLSGAEQIDLLYRAILGKEGDATGRAYWIGQLEQGHSIEQIAECFVGSVELLGKDYRPETWEFSL